MQTLFERFNQNPNAGLIFILFLTALVFIMSAVFRKEKKLQWQPSPNAVRALGIYAATATTLVLAAGFAAYHLANDLLGIVAFIGGFETCSEVLKRADSIATQVQPPEQNRT